MESKTMLIHICEYCRKLYQREHACATHEKFCKKNPCNKHKCFEFCTHLQKVEIMEMNFDHNGDATGEYISEIEFSCTKTGKDLYSYIAERKGLRVINFADRMPLKCDDYEMGRPTSTKRRNIED